ncbi:MAG: hypothetical protein ACN6OV_13330 [Acinetobacter sp.]|uniref:hypothetical protein n=1 Tax=Acinetobacter sp. TaxID=472 RepID=UPI003D0566B9
MNPQEKAQLIKEIHVLTHQFEHRALSLYEMARSKKRIHEIFALCNEPIFQKQVLTYKALTEPQTAAFDFAQQTPFALTFRGYFQKSDALEDILYQQPDMGWAFLHQARVWQIWMIPAPNRTALISEWGNFAECYDWLLEQQQLYQCLETDRELQQRAVPLHLPSLTESHTPILATQLEYESTENTETVSNPLDLTIDDVLAEDLHTVSTPDTAATAQSDAIPQEQEQVQSSTSTLIQEVAADVDIEPCEIQSAKPIPESIHIDQFTAKLQQIPQLEQDPPQLFELLILEQAELNLQIDFLLHANMLEHWDQYPIYLAEQMNIEGKFIKYLMLFGAQNQMEAIRLAQLFTLQHQHDLASIKEINTNLISQILSQPTDLYYYYQQAEGIWQKTDYFPFIPATLIQTQKFIHFDEPDTDFNTPILLLQERQKLRLIHGQKRLALSRTEQTYPCLILNRQQGLNWQTIQTVINQLAQPIDVQQLYQALKLYIHD